MPTATAVVLPSGVLRNRNSKMTRIRRSLWAYAVRKDRIVSSVSLKQALVSLSFEASAERAGQFQPREDEYDQYSEPPYRTHNTYVGLSASGTKNSGTRQRDPLLRRLCLSFSYVLECTLLFVAPLSLITPPSTIPFSTIPASITSPTTAPALPFAEIGQARSSTHCPAKRDAS